MKRIGRAMAMGVLCGLTMIGGTPALSAPPAAPALEAGQRVNINTASVDELLRLPGIGPSKAQAIVSHRQKEAFGKADDLRKVKGIGDRLFEQVKDHVTVGDNAPAKAGRGG